LPSAAFSDLTAGARYKTIILFSGGKAAPSPFSSMHSAAGLKLDMAIVTAALTALVSGIVAAIVTYRLNANKEVIFLMRRKAEELFIYTNEFSTRFVAHYYVYFSVFEGKMDYNSTLDLINSNTDKSDKGNDRRNMEMITRIYFPEIENYLDELFRRQDIVSTVVSAHKAAYKAQKADTSVWPRRLEEALLDFNQALEHFNNAIIAKAREYASDELIVMPKQWKSWASAKSTAIKRLAGEIFG
jgi:hypothetical protein